MKLLVDHNAEPSSFSRGEIVQDMINATQGMCVSLLTLDIIDNRTYIRNESWYMIRRWMLAHNFYH